MVSIKKGPDMMQPSPSAAIERISIRESYMVQARCIQALSDVGMSTTEAWTLSLVTSRTSFAVGRSPGKTETNEPMLRRGGHEAC